MRKTAKRIAQFLTRGHAASSPHGPPPGPFFALTHLDSSSRTPKEHAGTAAEKQAFSRAVGIPRVVLIFLLGTAVCVG